MTDLPSNSAANAVDFAIHTAVMDVAFNAAVTAVPLLPGMGWLKLPIIHTIFKWVLSQVFGLADKYLEKAAAFAVIDNQTSTELANYQASVVKLRQAIESGDDNAKAQATADFKANLAKLIHFDGA